MLTLDVWAAFNEWRRGYGGGTMPSQSESAGCQTCRAREGDDASRVCSSRAASAVLDAAITNVSGHTSGTPLKDYWARTDLHLKIYTRLVKSILFIAVSKSTSLNKLHHCDLFFFVIGYAGIGNLWPPETSVNITGLTFCRNVPFKQPVMPLKTVVDDHG